MVRLDQGVRAARRPQGDQHGGEDRQAGDEGEGVNDAVAEQEGDGPEEQDIAQRQAQRPQRVRPPAREELGRAMHAARDPGEAREGDDTPGQHAERARQAGEHTADKGEGHEQGQDGPAHATNQLKSHRAPVAPTA
jgi:hypothetical protein